MDADFFRSAIVDAVIPDNTTTSVKEIVQRAAELEREPNRILPISERELLFYGLFQSRPILAGFLLMLGQMKESEHWPF
jgi:hypothetical protein